MTTCAGAIGLALFSCLARDPACLPPDLQRLRTDLAAIAEQESGFNPWAIRDETTGESIYPLSREAAAREIVARLAARHTLGVGMFMITGEANWRRHGFRTVADLTDPCANMRAAGDHFDDDLKAAALQRYNSGRLNGAPRYAAEVAARRERLAPLLDTAPAAASSPAPPAPARAVSIFSRRDVRPGLFSRSAAPRSAPTPSAPPSEAGSAEARPQRLAERDQ